MGEVDVRGHIIDGGFFENNGAVTLEELAVRVLKRLEEKPQSDHKVCVSMCVYGRHTVRGVSLRTPRVVPRQQVGIHAENSHDGAFS
jgi:hypothetical protein